MPEVGPAVNYGKGQRSRKTNTHLLALPFLTPHNDWGSSQRVGRFPHPTLWSKITVGFRLLGALSQPPHYCGFGVLPVPKAPSQSLKLLPPPGRQTQLSPGSRSPAPQQRLS